MRVAYALNAISAAKTRATAAQLKQPTRLVALLSPGGSLGKKSGNYGQWLMDWLGGLKQPLRPQAQCYQREFRFMASASGNHAKRGRASWEYASVSTITPQSRLPASWRLTKKQLMRPGANSSAGWGGGKLWGRAGRAEKSWWL